MAEFTVVLGLAAAVLHGIAFVLYNVQAKLGKSKPNAASWSIWAFLAVLNALSFREMSGDSIATLQFFTGSIACFATFVYVLAIGKFARLKPKQWLMFALGLISTLVWWQFRSATGANMVILVALVFSFAPTLEGVWRDPSKETPLAWVLWTIAFTITITNILLRWKGHPIVLLTPVVLLVAHGAVAVLSRKSRKARFLKAA